MYLDVRVHDLAHLPGARRQRPGVAVEERVEPPRPGRRRHVHERVAFVEPGPAQCKHDRSNKYIYISAIDLAAVQS